MTRIFSAEESIGNRSHLHMNLQTHSRVVTFALLLLLLTFSVAFAGMRHGSGKRNMKKESVAGYFFNDQYIAHGFNYAYPEKSKVTLSRDTVKVGYLSLQFDLVPTEFSGGSICLKEKTFNLKPYLQKGALQFWIKGATGEERAWVALVDEDASDSNKTVVRVDISWFGKITTDWSFISIPLKHFGERGVYWDEKDKREVENVFDWSNVAEFRIEVRKDENTAFRVWVDDILVTKSIR